MANKSHSAKSASNFFKTQANKIKRLTKEVERNPNNILAREALEFWKTNDRKNKH